jgi:4,5-dihydroxyphthalate decarboxylase
MTGPRTDHASREPLSLAVGRYAHVHPLIDGSVRAAGIDLRIVQLPIEQILQRAFRHREWDVSEFSFAQYVALRGRGDTSVIAIPVFPSRVFRHGSIFVAQDDLSAPADLEGKRVGVPEWVQTAGVWARGILAEEYGVELASIEWVQAGVHEPGREEGISVALPAGVTLRARPDATLSALLDDGEIDAVISARAPRCARAVPRPLIADYRAAEASWAERTGVFPIMHVLVLRADVYERSPWIAQCLVDAFSAAAQQTIAAMADGTTSFIPLPWIADELEQLTALLGGGSWWPYGVGPNRVTLETFLSYAQAQGLAPPSMEVDDLFAPETLTEVRV